MRFMKIAIIGVLVGTTLWASVSTWRHSSVGTVAFPQGVSLRQESLQPGGAPVIPGAPRRRSHLGGGLRGGK